MNYHRFLVSGGPGCGKTTLINHLKILGYKTKTEAARKVIEWNLENGGKIFPWEDRDLFDRHLINIIDHDYKNIEPNIPVFYDGGALDILAWRIHLGKDNEEFNYIKNKYEYEKLVFIPEPWKEIYYTNDARPFKFEESKKITETIKNFYSELGYKIIPLGKETPMERAYRVQDIVSKFDI